jgi:hypothetical protein
VKIRFPFAVASLAFALAACGGEASDDAPATLPPVLPKPAAASKFEGMKVAHILIAKDGLGRREPKVKRTKADALALAKSLLADVKGGRDFLEVAAKFSEDVTDNKPNTNCGEVGTVAPEPVESEHYGYFLIKRIK